MTFSQRLDIEYYCWEHNWNSFEEAWEEFCKMTMNDFDYRGMHDIDWHLIRGTYDDFSKWVVNSGYCEKEENI